MAFQAKYPAHPVGSQEAKILSHPVIYKLENLWFKIIHLNFYCSFMITFLDVSHELKIDKKEAMWIFKPCEPTSDLDNIYVL